MSSLRQFGDDIWNVDGPAVHFIAAELPTRMTIVKLSDGSLWVNSPVMASLDVLKAIDAMGPVRFLVAPTPLHVWRLEQWHTLFPQAQLWAPPKPPRGSGRFDFAGRLADLPPAE